MKRRLSIINLTLEINLATFVLNTPVIIRVKLLEHSVEMSFSELKLVTDNILFIYSATNWETTKAFGWWKYNHGYEIVLAFIFQHPPLSYSREVSYTENVQIVYAKNWILLNRCCEISYMWVAVFKMVTWSRWYSLIIASGPDRLALGGICHSNSSTAHLWQHHLCNAKQFTCKRSSCVKVVAFIGLL